MSEERGTATPELQFVEIEVIRNGQPQRIRVLQQLWIKPDGSKEWRDVPLRRLRKGAKPDSPAASAG